MTSVNIIVGHSFHLDTNRNGYGIGVNNKLPWNIKEDLQNFKKITTLVPQDENIEYMNAVVMGRKTWDSIPNQYRPLSNRLNVVITSQDYENQEDVIFTNWNNFQKEILNYQNNYNLNICKSKKKLFINNIFIIGGESIYKLALETKTVKYIYATEVYQKMNCDTFMPNYMNCSQKFVLNDVSQFYNSNNLHYRFLTYVNHNEFKIQSNEKITQWQNKEEKNYIRLMKYILENGIERDDRTGTGTISSFGHQLKFNLRDTFPLSTTKRMFFRAIFEELKLYLIGKTDNKILQNKDIHIWDGNTSREFLDKRGLTEFPEGDMGATYGFNMRHYGGEYKDCHTNYGQDVGFDQLSYVIDLIKNNPTSRRIMINLWNPASLNKATLPSCLCQYQFYVNTQAQELNLQIYIRSSDYFLANNWNACTGALLVHLICSLYDVHLTPGELTVVTGDTHLYKTHLEQVRENIAREPYPFPKLVVKNKKRDITDFQFEDLQLIGYRAHPRIAADMAV